MRLSGVLSNAVRIISAIAMLALVLISIFVYHVNVFSLLIFFAFILCYVLLPGLFLIKAFGFSSGQLSADLLISFFLGWGLVLAEYFLTWHIHTRLLLYGLGPILSLCCICFIILHRNETRSRLSSIHPLHISAAFFLFLALLMGYVFVSTQYRYMSPDFADTVFVSIDIDKAYQMSLIGSLSHGYPLVDPLVAYRIVHYHIFSQILEAVPVMLFGLTPDFMVMSAAPYMTFGLVGLSTYSMFRYFCKRQDRIGVYALSFLLANMFVGKDIWTSYILRMFLTNDNHGGFAAPCMIAAVITVGVYFKNTAAKDKAVSLAFLTIITMVLTGIKAPIGLVLVCGIVGTFILGAILRKVPFIKGSLPAVLSFAGFFIVYKFILALDGTSGASFDSLLSPGHIASACFWKDPLTALMKEHGIPVPVRLMVVFAAFTVLFFTIYFLAFAIGYLRELVLVIGGKKEYDFAKVTVYAAAFAGYAAMILLKYSGHSEYYFGFSALIFGPLIAFWFFEDKDQITSKAMKGLFRISAVWFFALIFITSVTFSGFYASNYPTMKKHADPAATDYNPYKSLSHNEYEAMKWIRENTPEDALIATQMYTSEPKGEFYSTNNRWDHCHFLYAAYSVRNYYLEGSGFTFNKNENDERREMISNTDCLFDPDSERRGENARELGVTYVVVTQKIYPTPDLSSADYEKVFSNEDIDIYKVN